MKEKIAQYTRFLYFCNMKTNDLYNQISDQLIAAQGWDVTAKIALCQQFYENGELPALMPDDFWETVCRLAAEGHDCANFLLHCKYYAEGQYVQAFEYVRKACRHSEVPQAFVRLGIMYRDGRAITADGGMAMYFFRKAIDMGYGDCVDQIMKIYELGQRDIAEDLENCVKQGDKDELSFKLKLTRAILDRERKHGDYGNLSRLYQYLNMIYPKWDISKGANDIIHGGRTIDADCLYASCTMNNMYEVNNSFYDAFLQRLYAPIIECKEWNEIYGNVFFKDLKYNDLNEFVKSSDNLCSAFDMVCDECHVDRLVRITPYTEMQLLPYMPMSTIASVRKKAFFALIYLWSRIPNPDFEVFLKNMHDDMDAVDACEGMDSDTSIVNYFLCFIEYNFNAYAYELKNQLLLHAYLNNDMAKILEIMNGFVRMLDDERIKHPFPFFTEEDIPKIDVPSLLSNDGF